MLTVNVWFTHQVHKNCWFEIETVCNILFGFSIHGCDDTRTLLCLAAVPNRIAYKISHSEWYWLCFRHVSLLLLYVTCIPCRISHRWSIVGHYAFEFLLLFECEWLETTPFHTEIHGEWNIFLFCFVCCWINACNIIHTLIAYTHLIANCASYTESDLIKLCWAYVIFILLEIAPNNPFIIIMHFMFPSRWFLQRITWTKFRFIRYITCEMDCNRLERCRQTDFIYNVVNMNSLWCG